MSGESNQLTRVGHGLIVSDMCRACVRHVFLSNTYPTRTRVSWGRVHASEVIVSMVEVKHDFVKSEKLCGYFLLEGIQNCAFASPRKFLSFWILESFVR